MSTIDILRTAGVIAGICVVGLFFWGSGSGTAWACTKRLTIRRPTSYNPEDNFFRGFVCLVWPIAFPVYCAIISGIWLVEKTPALFFYLVYRGWRRIPDEKPKPQGSYR